MKHEACVTPRMKLVIQLYWAAASVVFLLDVWCVTRIVA